MGVIGKILKSVIKDTLQEIQLEIYEGYTLSSNQVLPPGINSVPLPDDQGVAIEIENNPGKMIQVGVYPEPLAEPGEIRIYSRDANGAQVSEIWQKKDGTITVNSNKTVIITSTDPIELNGNADNAVRFTKVKEVIDEIQNDITDLKAVFSTTWVPVPQDGGAALKTASGTWAGTALAKDIDDSKVDEVKLP